MIQTDSLSECKKYDIVIIGAGPSGIMAAISAAAFVDSASISGTTLASDPSSDSSSDSPSASGAVSASDSASDTTITSDSVSASETGSLSICILERNKSAAKKLLLTGNGRCNYTADIDMTGMLSAFGKKGRFFSEAFNGFSNRDLIAFFTAEGIEPEFEKSDENNSLVKVFPKNKNASSVRQCLIDKLQEKGIHVFYSFRAEKVLKVKNPNETGENYSFEIQQCRDHGFDNHLNLDVKNYLEMDDIGTGNPSYNNSKADISGSDNSSIDNYMADKSLSDNYMADKSSSGNYVADKSSVNNYVTGKSSSDDYMADNSSINNYVTGKSSSDDYKLKKELFRLFARKVIIATGGRTYPQTGSTGDGYTIAKTLGHSINELTPYLTPVFSKDRDISLLAGVSVKEVGLKILSGGKVIAKNKGSILFTHRGLSGPCAAGIGHEVYKLLNSDPGLKQGFIAASIDLVPDLSFEDFRSEIFRIYKSNPKKELNTILNMILKNVPQRLLDLILTRCKITKNLKIGNLSKIELAGIYDTAKNLVFKIDNVLHFDEAIVTEGGIPVKEINPRDLQSALTKGLYFAGEIIELAGPEGGFNLQKAFSTGWLAGKSAAESL